MPLIPLTSLDDDRLRPYRNLTDRQLEVLGNRFVIESEKLTRRALDASIAIESILTESRRADHVLTWAPPEVAVYTLPEKEMARVVGYQLHSGVVSCATRKPWPTLDALLSPKPGPACEPRSQAGPGSPPEPAPSPLRTPHSELRTPAPSPLRTPHSELRTLLICPQLKNTENLGSIIRVAAAFGVTGLLLGPTCCDPFCRRSVRVSMGSAFTLPIRKSDNLLTDLTRLREEFHLELLATVLDESAQPLHTLQRSPLPGALPGGVGLLMGHEVDGLPPDITALCHRRITIPMQLGTDSLNVSVATAVFLYHLCSPTTPIRFNESQ